MLTTYRYGSRFEMLHISHSRFWHSPRSRASVPSELQIESAILAATATGHDEQGPPARPGTPPVMARHHFRWSAAIASSTGWPIKSYPAGVGEPVGA
jgi:hypothetical protein